MRTRLYCVHALAFLGLVGCAETSDEADPAITSTASSPVTGADFALLNGPFTPSTQTVKRGSGTLFDITLESMNGFDGVVSFSASGTPIKTTSGFDPATLTGSGDETFEIDTIKPAHDPGGIGTPPGTYDITITGTSGALTHTIGVTLIVR